MNTNPRKEDAKITGIFIPLQPDEQHDPFILMHTLPIKQTAESMLKKLNAEKWEAFETSRLRQMTKGQRMRHDRIYHEYEVLLSQAHELLKPYLN